MGINGLNFNNMFDGAQTLAEADAKRKRTDQEAEPSGSNPKKTRISPSSYDMSINKEVIPIGSFFDQEEMAKGSGHHLTPALELSASSSEQSNNSRMHTIQELSNKHLPQQPAIPRLFTEHPVAATMTMPPEIKVPPSEISEFTAIKIRLTDWVNDPTVQGKKKKAYSRIIDAYLNGSNKLDLSKLQLTSIPREIGKLNALEFLDLSCNSLRELPSEVGNLSALEALDLSGNCLKKLSPEIGNLSTLEFFNLSYNSLREFPPEIAKLSALRVLNLAENRLTELPPKISSLSALEALRLDSNELRELPPEIGKLTALEALRLDSNELRELPPEIGKLTGLEELKLDSNYLGKLPPEIGKLSALKELYLYDSYLAELPPEIENLTLLQQLDLGANCLKEIPPEIGKLSALKSLELSGNCLEKLSPEIGKLSALKSLDLSGNRLTELPMKIGNLSLLEELYLENNKLRKLPNTIGDLFSLSTICIQGNALQQLPMSMANLTNVTDIKIEDTQIPQENLVAILDAIKAARKSNAVKRLGARLKLWKGYADKYLEKEDLKIKLKELAFIEEYNDQQKCLIYEWLVRLEKAKEFTEAQNELAYKAYRIMESLETNRPFKDHFFPQISGNLVRCEDRAAMAFNETYTDWILMTIKIDGDVKEKLKVIVGLSKTLTLRAELLKKIGLYERQMREENFRYKEGETTQILLYYETRLIKDLGLVTAIEHMSHKMIGKRDWINKAELKKSVNEGFWDVLAELPALNELFRKETSTSTFASSSSSTENPLANQLQELEERREGETVSEGDYLLLMNNLKDQYEQLKKKQLIEWVKGKLSLGL